MSLAAALEPAWYPVDGIRFRPSVPVVVSLHRPGFEILAVIEQDDRRRWWWFQCGVYGGPAHGWIENAREKLEMVGRTPPSDFSPRLFRPVDLARWDHKRTPLPAPVTPALGSSLQTARANPMAEPLDPHAGDDGWPYPRLTLGERTTPASREECEARLLRAWRTNALSHDVGHSTGSFCSDIPSEMVKVALKFTNRARLIEEARGGPIKPENYNAVRSGWTPTRRDFGDWDYALSWVAALRWDGRKAVEMRAADPPYSFRSIGGILHCHHATAQRTYDRAIDAAFATSKMIGTAA